MADQQIVARQEKGGVPPYPALGSPAPKTTASPSGERPTGFHVAWMLGIGLAGIFVTVLIIITGDLTTLWPLYIVPVALASIVYFTAGAVLSVAVFAALITLLAYGLGSPPVAQLLVGVSALTVSALAIGVQAGRHEHQRRLLEADVLHDAVTGVYTRDYVEAMLSCDVRRAQRYGHQCTFLLVGVTDMREFGRTFGRIKAEQMLARFAEVLQLAVRGTDTLGRWGADSFGLVMPFAGEAEAQLVIGRIVSAIEATEFEGDALEPVAHCRAAVGHAFCPDDGLDSAVLAEVAEKRLTDAREQAAACGRTAVT